jgi:hypothetical protein
MSESVLFSALNQDARVESNEHCLFVSALDLLRKTHAVRKAENHNLAILEHDKKAN